MKKIVLSLIAVVSIFAAENNMHALQKQENNKTNISQNLSSKSKSTNNNTKKLTEKEMTLLARKHINYVLTYKEFLNKLAQRKLDYKKPVILLIGTPDCKWTKKELIDLLGYPPLWNEIKNNFTLVSVNLLKDKLPEIFLVSITPTMYFVSPVTGKILTDKPVAGYVDKDDLLIYLKGLKKAWNIYLKKAEFHIHIKATKATIKK